MTSIALDTFKANPLGTETTIEDVYEAFEFLEDWEERYGYIIDLGKSLPEFPDTERNESNYVHGCQSQVWLIHNYDEENNTLYLMIDSYKHLHRHLLKNNAYRLFLKRGRFQLHRIQYLQYCYRL